MLGLLYCPQAWDLGQCLHSPSCYGLEQHYPLWPDEIQSPSNRFQSMFCFKDWMDFKILWATSNGFQNTFCFEDCMCIQILWWILNLFQITFSCEDCMGFKWTSIDFKWVSNAFCFKDCKGLNLCIVVHSIKSWSRS